jgi:putative membrane protein
VRKAVSVMATAGLALALAGCGPKAENKFASAQNSVADATEATSNAISNAAGDVKEAVMPTPSGQEFVDTAAKSDAFEIASAKLAKEKAGSADLKSFAAMMITDHTASTAKIKKAAGEASPKLTPDPMLTDGQQSKLDALNKLSGKDFDKEYADQQVDAHEKALSLMQTYASKGEVASLKTAAGEIAPKVETHLDKIKGIKDKL